MARGWIRFMVGPASAVRSTTFSSAGSPPHPSKALAAAERISFET